MRYLVGSLKLVVRSKHVAEVIVNALRYLLVVLFDHSVASTEGNDNCLL